MLNTRVLVHVVISNSGRGVCSAIIQDKQTGKRERSDAVIVIVNVAVLKGDSCS